MGIKRIIGKIISCCVIAALVSSLCHVCVVMAKDDSLDESETVKHEYELYVDRVSNVVAVYEVVDGENSVSDDVFESDGKFLKRIKTMVCSCGRRGHSTPTGTYRTGDSYEWRYMIDGSYAQYAVRFNGHILFHSVPYHKMSHDSLEWEEYNKLGSAASLGCVRLCVADAKWIYDNCDRGTRVTVFDGDGSDPVRPPDPRRISESSPNRGWDPTDPCEDNPWNRRNRYVIKK